MLGKSRWELYMLVVALGLSVCFPIGARAQQTDFSAKVQRFEQAFSRTFRDLQHPGNWIRIQPVEGMATLCITVHQVQRRAWQGSEYWRRWLESSEANQEWQHAVFPGYTGDTMFPYLDNDYQVRSTYNGCGRILFRGVQAVFGPSDEYRAVRLSVVYPHIRNQTIHFVLPTDALDLVREGAFLNQGLIERMRITIGDHPITLDTYNGPLIDCHAHFNGLFGGRRAGTPEAEPEMILRRMSMAGVERIVLMTDRRWMQDCVTFARQSQGKVILFADFSDHGGRTGHDLHVEDFVQRLRTNVYRGIGELYARNRQVLRLPANSSAYMRIYELAARHNLPVAVHNEVIHDAPEGYRRAMGITPRQSAEEWADALRSNRQTTFIWCHCGFAPADVVRRFLQAHPNLYCDISRPPLDWTLPLPDDWRRLITDFPNRFLFGSCVKTSQGHEGEVHYEVLVERYRRALSYLQSGIAERVGYRNAMALLRLQPLPKPQTGRGGISR